MGRIINLIIICFFVTNLFSKEVETKEIFNLLNSIEKKTDLSQKTKLENGGVSFIYTRDDLKRMQAKSLKDILKSTYPFGYNENRYGRPDPLTFNTTAPFLSSMIRVFIDNQEITTGLYGSGIVVLGDIDLGFVDHIEIYTQNPSYEFSTEATFVLVKLYTKVAQKDEGGKVEISSSSYNANSVSGHYSQELDDWSYFSYVSKDNIKRKKYKSHNTELSRDKKRLHLLASLYNTNNRILFQAIRTKEDAFIGKSVDATPLKNTNDTDFLHLGYDTKIKDFSFLASYDYMLNDKYFADDIGAIRTSDIKLSSHVYSTELKYNHIFLNNKLVVGGKYRVKKSHYTSRIANGVSLEVPNIDTQTISTVFLENQYSLEENSILTTGVSSSLVRNNNSSQDDDLLMYRIGHTYTTKNFVFKTIASRVEISPDPYLINGQNPYTVFGDKKVQTLDSIIEHITYEVDQNKYELLLTNLKSKNYLVPVLPEMKIDNYDKDVITNGVLARWTHNYNTFDKLFLTFGYLKKEDLPFIGEQKQYIGILKNINTYKKFDLFNEMLFYKYSTEDKEFYDYSMGVKYHYSDDLTISFKGENLLNKAKTTSYARLNTQLLSSSILSQEEPLEISPIDRRVMISVEYLF